MRKLLIGEDLGSYTFNPGVSGVGNIVISSITNLEKKQILGVYNTDSAGLPIYSPGLAGRGGDLTGTGPYVLTLDFDTATMSSGDELQIIYVDSSALPVNDLGLPDSLGVKTMANSTSITLASDQTPFPVAFTPTGTQDVNIVSTIPLPITDNGGSLTVDGTVELGATSLAALENISATVSATDLDIRDLTFATDKVDTTGSSISVSASALPTGAATSALQTTGNNSLSNIDGKITLDADTGIKVHVQNTSGLTTVALDAPTLAALESITVQNPAGAGAVNIQDGGNSITVDAVSLPLPTGASTSALQTTGNNSLASIDAGIPAALGQTTMVNSMPVVIASDQSTINVTNQGLLVTANSSTTPLAALATFTGAWSEVKDYGIIYISVVSDQGSSAGGFIVDFSADGVTSIGSTDSHTISANTLKSFAFNPAARYMRVRYINGGVLQTSFTLQTIFKLNGLPSSHPLGTVFNDQNDGQLVLSSLRANSSGNTIPVICDTAGRLVNADSKAEDDAHASGDRGVFCLGVANEAQATFVSADGDYTPIATTTKGHVYTTLAPPLPSNILSGSSTTAATLITVPANRIWRGTIQVSGAITAGLNAAAANGNARIVWTPGTGGTTAYTPAQVMLSTPLIGLTALVGVSNNDSVVVMDVEVYAGTTAGTIALASTNVTQLFGAASGKIIN